MTVAHAPRRPDRAAIFARMRDIVGPKGWIDGAADMERYVTEERAMYRGQASAVVRPASTAEVAAIVAAAAEAGIGIVPQGGNTSLCGGSVPGPGDEQIVLSLGRMNRVRAIDVMNYTMEVEAGCVLADLQRAAADADRLFPLSLAAEGSCQIGGNLSTNAGGTGVLRYGNARDLVLGLEVVLPDGSVIDGLGRLRKDNTGYDLRHLFCGAEGTLGIITAAVLKLFPKPRDQRTALIALPDIASAVPLLAKARAATGDAVTAFEYIDRICLDFVFKHTPDTVDPLAQRYRHYLLMELTTTADGDASLGERFEALMEQALADGLILDAAVAQNEAQSRQLWKLRESIPEAQKHEGASIKHDISVAVSRVPEFITRATDLVERALPGLRVVAFGHVGDGNVHFNLSQPIGADGAIFAAERPGLNSIVHELVHEMGGSFSAEHGVGQLKRGELVRYKSAAAVDVMRRIKAAIDPQNIMNPGKVL
ncbi:MAG: FAD-binding oxidoreductase [Alphaproteobacteria bacterium]|nr:FAD-binding oxidoreductase [Alphaproteobacteria bacterium]